ncbi:hypothetical protein SAMN05444365_10517 [Micromonospora pattaloongensis]|uniref:Uncharacterized protein n=1 Tax=Micromonospora pattaloongensis TaxID=405436 RepID=A0A1H3PTV1_9ACTN|nr:hypothetical protein [Micromonospora pattaloongensis]SDZ04410.1 hypothetical protein SAMN05444365_10517 [Micromonospora pattaloongensis]
MRRWKWFQRRREPVDTIGPATVYGGQRGAYASGAAPSAQPNWNAMTQVQGLPLLTYGQRRQYDVGERP